MKVQASSYVVKVPLTFVDKNGNINRYSETVAVCTNIVDAQSVVKSKKDAFIVPVGA